MTENRTSKIPLDKLINERNYVTSLTLSGKLLNLIVSIHDYFLVLCINLFYRNAIFSVKPLAYHLENDIFPDLIKKRVRWLVLEPVMNESGEKNLTGTAEKNTYAFPGTGDVCDFMMKNGIGKLKFNTSLEYNQIIEAFLIYAFSVSILTNKNYNPVKKSRWLSKKQIASQILSDKGLHLFCSDMRYFRDEKVFEVDYTYCELMMSRFMSQLTSMNSKFGDHRMFFSLGPGLAGGSFLFFALVAVLYAFNINIIIYMWILLTILFPAFLWGLMITFGSLKYEKEHDELLKDEYMRHENILARFPETNPNPIIQVGKNGEIKYANPATFELLKHVSGEMQPEAILPVDFKKIAAGYDEEPKGLQSEIKVADKYLKYLISFFQEDRSLIFAGNDISDLRNTELQLRDLNNNLETLVDKRTKELYLTQDITIMCLAGISEVRDPETGAHIDRTRTYVRALAEHLKEHPKYREFLSGRMVDLLYKSAPLHDIGKVGVPDSILLKPGKLTDDEFDIMKLHTDFGARALEKAVESLGFDSFLDVGMEIAQSHHEKWDGSGYPQGLSGESIPFSARLMALADVYDALISKRVYKEAFSHEKAAAIIFEGDGKHFDPVVVEAFRNIEQDFIDIAKDFPDPD